MNTPSANEYDMLRRISLEERYSVMSLYLIGDGSRTYNMEEVANKYYGNSGYSRRVSMICRCYNFYGNNCGKYRPKATICKRLGRNITTNDIAAFVKSYPHGITSPDTTFDQWLGVPEYSQQRNQSPRQTQANSYYYTQLEMPRSWQIDDEASQFKPPYGIKKDTHGRQTSVQFGQQHNTETYQSGNKKARYQLDFRNITLKSAIGGVVFFALFWHAAQYYRAAGNPISLSIIAAIIAFIGGIAIAFRLFRKEN